MWSKYRKNITVSRIFFSEDINFDNSFTEFLSLRRNKNTDIVSTVSTIVSRIREEGDSALVGYTQKFDDFDLEKNGFFFTEDEIENSENLVSKNDKSALRLAIERVTSFHEIQMPKNFSWTDNIGAKLGWTWKPIERVGAYVPGGTASYPSSAIMNIVPAKVAGVRDLILCSPTPRGKYNPMVLYSAKELGVKTIVRLGGAQAIAAMALGTSSLKKVNKVTGPGNAYVSEAKRQLVGEVGIDALAGPSEVVIICDKSMPPDLTAIDLLAQAEHDEKAQSIVITDDEKYAKLVEKHVQRFLKNLKRKNIALKSWEKFGAIIVVPNFSRAFEISNQIAPEHLQLCFSNAEREISNVKNAGAVFVGKWAPEALGDYISGSNHVLPTNGTAKFSSSLSVFDFLKRISITRIQKNSFEILAASAIRLADSEGLEAHSLSISERLKKDQ